MHLDLGGRLRHWSFTLCQIVHNQPGVGLGALGLGILIFLVPSLSFCVHFFLRALDSGLDFGSIERAYDAHGLDDHRFHRNLAAGNGRMSGYGRVANLLYGFHALHHLAENGVGGAVTGLIQRGVVDHVDEELRGCRVRLSTQTGHGNRAASVL